MVRYHPYSAISHARNGNRSDSKCHWPLVMDHQQILLPRSESFHQNHIFASLETDQTQNYNQPVLLLSNRGNNSYPESPEWNVYDFGSHTSIRILLKNPGFAFHPMHLHGHNFYLLATGPGEWDGKTIINPQNPSRRDTLVIPPMSYAVMQFEADNPGSWPLHCHIAAHVAGGLYATILERPDLIAQQNIPLIMNQTCNDYVAWQQSGEVVDQVDSGV
jgi:hypothetical protein